MAKELSVGRPRVRAEELKVPTRKVLDEFGKCHGCYISGSIVQTHGTFGENSNSQMSINYSPTFNFKNRRGYFKRDDLYESHWLNHHQAKIYRTIFSFTI